MNILDIIFIIIFVLFLIYGYFKGVLGQILDIASIVVTFCAFKILYPFIYSYLSNSMLFLKTKLFFENKINVNNIIQDATTYKEYIDNLNIPNFLKNMLLNIDITDVTKDYIVDFISSFFITVVSFLFLSIIIFIFSHILKITLKIFKNLPIIKTFDKAFGILFSGLKFIFLFWIISMIFIIIYPAKTALMFFYYIEDSSIAYYFFNNNLLFNFLLDILKNLFF